MFLPSRFLYRCEIESITKVNLAKLSQARVPHKHTAIRTHSTGLLLYTGSQPTVLALQTGKIKLVQCNGCAVPHHQCSCQAQSDSCNQAVSDWGPASQCRLTSLSAGPDDQHRLKQQTTDPFEKVCAWELAMFCQQILPGLTQLPDDANLGTIPESPYRCEASCIA